MLYCMRHVGDAHLNPVVSVALLLTRRASVIKCLLFVAAQFLGAIIGAGLAVAVTSAQLRAGRQASALNRGFQPTQRTQRKERNEMTSLWDRPITAASDDGVCRWHAAKLWQTREKLLKLNLICIRSCTTSKKRIKISTIDF